MIRNHQPEILDTLTADDPEALASRRDLLLINRIMGNFSWFIRVLRSRVRPGERVLEIGAGTGELCRQMQSAGIAADGLDLWPKSDTWSPLHRWHQSDLRIFDGYDPYRVFACNLILHQFPDSDLAVLGKTLSRNARLIVVNEPTRSKKAQAALGGLGPLLRLNRVTRYDGHVSIGAGFLDQELPRLLQLDPAQWTWSCRMTWRGSYRMIAERRL